MISEINDKKNVIVDLLVSKYLILVENNEIDYKELITNISYYAINYWLYYMIISIFLLTMIILIEIRKISNSFLNLKKEISILTFDSYGKKFIDISNIINLQDERSARKLTMIKKVLS